MFNKRYMFVLVLLIIAITSLSAVSAADLNTTDEVVGDEVSVDGDLEQTEDVSLDATPGTFTQLNKLISENTVVNLQKNYSYVCPDDNEFQGGIHIDKNLVINGNGYTIFGNGARFFVIGENAKVTITGVNFQNTRSYHWNYGGGIYNKGDLTLRSCQFRNSTAGVNGGAIFSINTLEIVDCEFGNNVVEIDEEDDVQTAGGAIFSQGLLVIEDSYFSFNFAEYGGAIFNYNDTTTVMYNTFFLGNGALDGGAVYNYADGFCLSEGSSFWWNRAERGAGMYNCFANLTQFHGNEADDYGNNMYGGLALDCSLLTDDNDYADTILRFNVKLTPTKTTLLYSEKLGVKVTDVFNGVGVPGITVKIKIKTKSGFKYFTAKTNENGIAYIPIEISPATYSGSVITSLAVSTILAGTKTVKLVIKKETPKITASAKTFKLKATKKYTITVKGSKGVAVKNTNVKIKVKGVTYSAKTNAKGQATFTLSKLNRKGSFSSTITIAANTNYNKATKTVTIKVA